ncbi:MAG TPA: SET domain-containing protein-lysine N-methyltransferase [Polyangiaceae bacterium]|jgi:histone-lysine N-methyltransferase SETD1
MSSSQSKRRAIKPMFSLSPVLFRNSDIAGRGVFARRRFEPGEVVVAYAPRQRRVPAKSPEAAAASHTKLTLLSGDQVIIPDTAVPGGWLCNHSCDPNATLYASGDGRIQCLRPIAPGDEVTIFYGWVSENEPERDPCRCGSPRCRGFINFDVTDEDAAHVEVVDGPQVVMDDVVRTKFEEYGAYLRSIGQDQVTEAIANALVRIKGRA